MTGLNMDATVLQFINYVFGLAAVSFLDFIQGSGAKGNAAATPGKLPTVKVINPAGFNVLVNIP